MCGTWSGVRVAAGAHQPDVDGLDHGSGGVQPVRGDLQAVPGHQTVLDAPGPDAGDQQRAGHHRLQHPALPRAPTQLRRRRNSVRFSRLLCSLKLGLNEKL